MTQDIFLRKLRAGMVGGGADSFIGTVHRAAARLDGQAEIVAGALSADPEKARTSAQALFVDRSYASYQEMAEAESVRPDGIDFVMVVTPNHLHFPVVKTFLNKNIPVICDKPMTLNLTEAHELVKLVEERQLVFALTHNYTGYPAVRQARQMVQEGRLGEIRKVQVEYVQDWLMESQELNGNKQAEWRTDPARSGLGGSVADIGTHAQNLLEYISGLKIKALCADLSSFVEGRVLDDDANVLLRMENGAKGILTCSQIAAGEENRLTIQLYGTKAGLEWQQMEPNSLVFKQPGQPSQLLRVGQPYMSEAAKAVTRLPTGHPEGFQEAFANIYRLAIKDIRRAGAGLPRSGGYPTVYDGLRGMEFISTVVESSKQGSIWLDFSRGSRAK